MRRRRNFSPRVSKDVPGCSRILSAGNCVPSQLGVLTSMAQQSLFNFFPKPAKRSKSSNEADRLPCTETDELIVYVEIQQVIFKPSYLQL